MHSFTNALLSLLSLPKALKKGLFFLLLLASYRAMASNLTQFPAVMSSMSLTQPSVYLAYMTVSGLSDVCCTTFYLKAFRHRATSSRDQEPLVFKPPLLSIFPKALCRCRNKAHGFVCFSCQVKPKKGRVFLCCGKLWLWFVIKASL